MPNLKLYIFTFFFFFLILTESVFACQISWRSKKKLQQEANLVVIAEIVSAKHLGASFRGDSYQYKLRVSSVKQGKLKDMELTVTFEDLKSHLRGTQRVCPIKIGSGIEHSLKLGAHYKIYLRSANSPEILLAQVG